MLQYTPEILLFPFSSSFTSCLPLLILPLLPPPESLFYPLPLPFLFLLTPSLPYPSFPLPFFHPLFSPSPPLLLFPLSPHQRKKANWTLFCPSPISFHPLFLCSPLSSYDYFSSPSCPLLRNTLSPLLTAQFLAFQLSACQGPSSSLTLCSVQYL